ncbi:hypothetical protein EV421DRAFT_1736315 [Armillaria borealis]|uniref:Uncharacterized protein n=1 Tax=Armillaria borealis TaxID=47425 RepID=A0AA39JGZ3_9AGAR|nr:hypothetical protein EV421DRAFT_1736315 [Armillaria borealis]
MANYTGNPVALRSRLPSRVSAQISVRSSTSSVSKEKATAPTPTRIATCSRNMIAVVNGSSITSTTVSGQNTERTGRRLDDATTYYFVDVLVPVKFSTFVPILTAGWHLTTVCEIDTGAVVILFSTSAIKVSFHSSWIHVVYIAKYYKTRSLRNVSSFGRANPTQGSLTGIFDEMYGAPFEDRMLVQACIQSSRLSIYFFYLADGTADQIRVLIKSDNKRSWLFYTGVWVNYTCSNSDSDQYSGYRCWIMVVQSQALQSPAYVEYTRCKTTHQNDKDKTTSKGDHLELQIYCRGFGDSCQAGNNEVERSAEHL